MDLLPYLMANLQYFILLLVSLLLWDLVDFYIELRSFRFLHNSVFIAYYGTRALFCLLVLEIAYSLGVVDLKAKYLISFIMPLFFAAVLQNLVIYIGKTASDVGNVNIREVFDRFRFQVQMDLRRREESRNVSIEKKLLLSKTPTNEIQQILRLYLTEEQCQKLESRIANWPEESRRIAMIKVLEKRAGTTRPLEELLRHSGQAT